MAPPMLTANSPQAGSIAWTAFNIAYRGKSYAIPTGNTSSKYTWWLYNGGAGGPLQFGSTLPALTADDCLLFLNKGGIPVLIPTAQAIDGSLLVAGSVVAGALQAGSITTDVLAAGAITADKLAAGSITAAALAADAITGKTITGGVISGTTINGGSIVGTTMSTASSGPRIVLSNGGQGGFAATEVHLFSGSAMEQVSGVIGVNNVGGYNTSDLYMQPPNMLNSSSAHSQDLPILQMQSAYLDSNNNNAKVKAITALDTDRFWLGVYYPGSEIALETTKANLILEDSDSSAVLATTQASLRLDDTNGFSYNGKFTNGTGLVANRASIANGTYTYVTFTFGPTMKTVPMVASDMDIAGYASEHSQAFVSTTSFRQYSYTDAGASRWSSANGPAANGTVVWVPYIAVAI